MPREKQPHNAVVVEQFTKQAAPFAEKQEHVQQEPMRLTLAAMHLQPTDRVLDVACGPGLMACEFAQRVQQVMATDLTPAMLEQGRKRAAAQGLNNIVWRVADAAALPFETDSMAVVFTRYSFHHFPDPLAVLREMTRVCAPDGRVAVVDVYSADKEQQAVYDGLEKLRDPSHTHALVLEDFRALFKPAGLELQTQTPYRLKMDAKELLASSFPNDGDGEKFLQQLNDDIGVNRSGFDPHIEGGKTKLTFPVMIFVARKPG